MPSYADNPTNPKLIALTPQIHEARDRGPPRECELVPHNHAIHTCKATDSTAICMRTLAHDQEVRLRHRTASGTLACRVGYVRVERELSRCAEVGHF